MRQTIWLPITEPKCITRTCRHPVPCARRDISAEGGRPVKDFSLPLSYIPDCCAPKWAMHIPYSAAVKPEAGQAPAKEWIGS